MEEQDFRRHADQALDELYRKLARAADQYDFETDFNAGALAIEFEDPPAKFVVSPNAPVGQIWVSAHSRSYKLDWVPERSAFVFPENGFSLTELIAGAISRQLGIEVPL